MATTGASNSSNSRFKILRGTIVLNTRQNSCTFKKTVQTFQAQTKIETFRIQLTSTATMSLVEKEVTPDKLAILNFLSPRQTRS